MKAIRSILSPCLLGGSALLCSATLALGDLRIGFSFNEGAAGVNDPVQDFYLNQNGAYLDDWDGATFFGSGFSGESGDTAIYGTAASPRATLDLGDTTFTAWGSFTLEMNVFIGETIGNFRRAVDLGGDSSIIWTDTDALRLRLASTGDINSDAIDREAWYHVAMVYDSALATDNVFFYIDGSLIGTGTDLRAGLPATPGLVHILANENGGSRWDGGSAIDDFRFTAAALDPSEFLTEGFGDQLVIPEPSVMGMMGFGFLLMLWRRRLAEPRPARR